MFQSATLADVTRSAGDPERFKKAFGERLFEILRAAGKSQTWLAKKSGVERTTITRIIKGKRRANNDHLSLFAAALKLEPSALMPGADGQTSAIDQGNTERSPKVSDPSGNVPPSDSDGGYTVTSDEGIYIGKQFDAMPKAERRGAMLAVMKLLEDRANPSELVAPAAGPRRAQPK